MNIVSTLIKNNQHKVDNKEIYWKITKFSLELKVNLNSQKYEKSDIKLPPEELGICKDWRKVVNSTDSNIITFKGIWDLRRVDDKLSNVNMISEKLMELAL